MRAFVAVDLPAEMHDKIADVQSKFNTFKFKFVDPSIVHITLKFLGDVPEERISQVSQALDSVSCAPFRVNVKGVGVFPKPKFAKVIWLGFDGDFEQLYNSVEQSLSPFEFEESLHKFSAHATLARVKYLPKKKKKEFLETVEELRDVDIGSMDINALKLKKSILTPQGPLYETLHEITL